MRPTAAPRLLTAALSLGLAAGLGACGDGSPDVEAPAAAEAPAPPLEIDKTVDLSFELGTPRATVADTLVGAARHDYLVRAAAGQTLTAAVASDGPPTVAVIGNDGYRSGDAEPLPSAGDAAGDGRTWRGPLPGDGVYRVRVAHPGPAGGPVSPYSLSVTVE